jgi:hypothetical protein
MGDRLQDAERTVVRVKVHLVGAFLEEVIFHETVDRLLDLGPQKVEPCRLLDDVVHVRRARSELTGALMKGVENDAIQVFGFHYP